MNPITPTQEPRQEPHQEEETKTEGVAMELTEIGEPEPQEEPRPMFGQRAKYLWFENNGDCEAAAAQVRGANTLLWRPRACLGSSTRH